MKLRDSLLEEWLSPKEVDARQLTKARDLVKHAMLNVPWYRETYQNAGVIPDDIRKWSDWRALPLLTKDDIRTAGDAMLAATVDKRALLQHYSGGSTGVPLSFYHDIESVSLSDAGTYRGFLRAGWKPGDMVAFFWGSSERLRSMGRLEFAIRQRLRRMYQFDAFAAGPVNYRQWAATLARIRPSIVYGYASAIADFASFCEQSGISLPAVRGVFTTAEKLYSPQRELIESAFSAKVFDCYGSSEVRNIATECDRGSMHINADFAVVETTGESADGDSPLLVTSLISRAMPFIRYANGDVGSLASGQCECGRGFPLMHLSIGRTNDHIVLRDGSRPHSLALIYQLYGSRGVRTFQFHQTSLGSATLYVVPAEASEQELDESLEKATRGIAELLKGQLQVEVRKVDSIPRTQAGKHTYVRSDIA